MQLPLQDFATLVKTQASAVRASCAQLVDLTVGSVLRATLEANASVGLWIQWLIVQVLAATRAATSTGGDLDSWVADFGMTRLPAAEAAGSVRFSRITAGLGTNVPVGALVRTGLGTADQVFAVAADPTNPAWNGEAYQLSPSDLSIVARVVAQQPGAVGNVVAGSVTLLASALPGIDAVTNDAPMGGGVDAETDAALRTRFSGFLDSRNRATTQSVEFAIASVRRGLTYTIAERIDASGVVRPGHFTVTVDDGTGAPADSLVEQIATAIDAVRPIGGTFSIRPPLIIPVNVEIHVGGSSAAQANVKAAVTAYVAALPIGASLTLTRLYQVAYGADASISNVYGAILNGASADIIPPVFGLVRPSSVAVAL